MKNEPYKYDPKVVQAFFDHDYVDRGMLKWQGYYLSDHTSALKKEAAIKHEHHLAKPQQSTMTITKILAQAFTKHQHVSIQCLSHRSDGQLMADITGAVLGYQENNVYLSHKQSVAISEIRHIEILPRDE
ncbi:hypothetical protein [Furfurilactobacillus curtus]|uniref:DNA-directed RNA polymerase beta subunit n=1 Tax=Furfurilactobacillus curtus TaxID=1746200 RepID=A0ABQ5JKK7_9LACO